MDPAWDAFAHAACASRLKRMREAKTQQRIFSSSPQNAVAELLWTRGVRMTSSIDQVLRQLHELDMINREASSFLRGIEREWQHYRMRLHAHPELHRRYFAHREPNPYDVGSWSLAHVFCHVTLANVFRNPMYRVAGHLLHTPFLHRLQGAVSARTHDPQGTLLQRLAAQRLHTAADTHHARADETHTIGEMHKLLDDTLECVSRHMQSVQTVWQREVDAVNETRNRRLTVAGNQWHIDASLLTPKKPLMDLPARMERLQQKCAQRARAWIHTLAQRVEAADNVASALEEEKARVEASKGRLMVAQRPFEFLQAHLSEYYRTRHRSEAVQHALFSMRQLGDKVRALQLALAPLDSSDELDEALRTTLHGLQKDRAALGGGPDLPSTPDDYNRQLELCLEMDLVDFQLLCFPIYSDVIKGLRSDQEIKTHMLHRMRNSEPSIHHTHLVRFLGHETRLFDSLELAHMQFSFDGSQQLTMSAYFEVVGAACRNIEQKLVRWSTTQNTQQLEALFAMDEEEDARALATAYTDWMVQDATAWEAYRAHLKRAYKRLVTHVHPYAQHRMQKIRELERQKEPAFADVLDATLVVLRASCWVDGAVLDSFRGTGARVVADAPQSDDPPVSFSLA
jgi:hypothetical protein